MGSLATNTLPMMDLAAYPDQAYDEFTPIQGGEEHEAKLRIQAAMRSLAPGRLDAYQKAVSKAPDLVQQESSYASYLKVCKGDVEDAAERLASYWTERVVVFGEDRAFMRLELLDGSGALCKEDVQVLQTGYLSQLPSIEPNAPVEFTDPNMRGRSNRTAAGTASAQSADSTRRTHVVLYLDPSRLQEVPTLAPVLIHRQRVLFYWMHQLTKSSVASQHQMQFLFHVPASLQVENVKRIATLIKCAPLTILGMHICGVLPDNQASFAMTRRGTPTNTAVASASAFVTLVTSQLMLLSTQWHPPVVGAHISNRAGIYKKLAAHGFDSTASVPMSCGGTWTFTQLAESLPSQGDEPEARPSKRAKATMTLGASESPGLAPLEQAVVDSRLILAQHGCSSQNIVSDKKVSTLLQAVKQIVQQQSQERQEPVSLMSLLAKRNVQTYLKRVLETSSPSTPNTSRQAPSHSALQLQKTTVPVSLTSTKSQQKTGQKTIEEASSDKKHFKTLVLQSMLRNLKQKDPSPPLGCVSARRQINPVRQALASQVLQNVQLNRKKSKAS